MVITDVMTVRRSVGGPAAPAAKQPKSLMEFSDCHPVISAWFGRHFAQNGHF